MKERLQKILSECGICSRRKAEEMIQAQRVCVNGEIAPLGAKADIDVDEITIDGNPVTRVEKKVYIVLNKPVGYVTTMSDEKGRKTVMDLVSDVGTRVYPVGRLDCNSEGLLLMTNDGELANKITHPSFEKEKTYRVSAYGDIKSAINKLLQPMYIDSYRIRPAHVRVVKLHKSGGIIDITIHEGRNRQVRKMCAQAGLIVKKLCRISIDKIRLGALPKGKWRNLSQKEIDSLLKEPGKEK